MPPLNSRILLWAPRSCLGYRRALWRTCARHSAPLLLQWSRSGSKFVCARRSDIWRTREPQPRSARMWERQHPPFDLPRGVPSRPGPARRSHGDDPPTTRQNRGRTRGCASSAPQAPRRPFADAAPEEERVEGPGALARRPPRAPAGGAMDNGRPLGIEPARARGSHRLRRGGPPQLPLLLQTAVDEHGAAHIDVAA